MSEAALETPVVELEKVGKSYRQRGRTVQVLADVSLSVRPGETLALVGGSGSGKTTVSRIICGLTAPTSGRVLIDGTERTGRRPTLAEHRRVQIVFQDPHASMNPRMRVGAVVAEPLLTHQGEELGRDGIRDRVGTLLEQVGLDPDTAHRYPHEFSGGQRQRIAIARAIALRPALLILDEPTSSLDVSVQARVLELLRSLQAEFSMAYLFVSHNLAVVADLADRVAVLDAGELIEVGAADQVLREPRAEGTRRLVDAVPVLDPRRANPRFAGGAVGG